MKQLIFAAMLIASTLVLGSCGIGDEVRESFEFSFVVPAGSQPSETVSFQESFTFQTERAASANSVTIDKVFVTTPNQREEDLSFIADFELSIVQGQGTIRLAEEDQFPEERAVALEPTFAGDARSLIGTDNAIELRATVTKNPDYPMPEGGIEVLVLTRIFVEK
jgi:hypothetical protein